MNTITKNRDDSKQISIRPYVDLIIKHVLNFPNEITTVKTITKKELKTDYGFENLFTIPVTTKRYTGIINGDFYDLKHGFDKALSNNINECVLEPPYDILIIENYSNTMDLVILCLSNKNPCLIFYPHLHPFQFRVGFYLNPELSFNQSDLLFEIPFTNEFLYNINKTKSKYKEYENLIVGVLSISSFFFAYFGITFFVFLTIFVIFYVKILPNSLVLKTYENLFQYSLDRISTKLSSINFKLFKIDHSSDNSSVIDSLTRERKEYIFLREKIKSSLKYHKTQGEFKLDLEDTEYYKNDEDYNYFLEYKKILKDLD